MGLLGKEISRREALKIGGFAATQLVYNGLNYSSQEECRETLRQIDGFNRLIRAGLVEPLSSEEEAKFRSQLSNDLNIHKTQDFDVAVDRVESGGYIYSTYTTRYPQPGGGVKERHAVGVKRHQTSNRLIIAMHSLLGLEADSKMFYGPWKLLLNEGAELFFPIVNSLCLQDDIADFSKKNKHIPLNLGGKVPYIDANILDALDSIYGFLRINNYTNSTPTELIGISHGGTVGANALALWKLYQETYGRNLPNLNHVGLFAPINTFFDRNVVLNQVNGEGGLGEVYAKMVFETLYKYFCLENGYKGNIWDYTSPAYEAFDKAESNLNVDYNISSVDEAWVQKYPERYAQIRAQLFRSSPRELFRYASKESMLPTLPTIQLYHAVFDELVPAQQTRDFYTTLNQLDISAKSNWWMGGHIFNLHGLTLPLDLLEKP